MSQFALFAGEDHYPCGGWRDFVLCGSMEECQARLTSWTEYEAIPSENDFRWAHIVDLTDMKIVLYAVGSGDGSQRVAWSPKDPHRWD